MTSTFPSSARLKARVAGALYLMCIACGFFAEMAVRAKLIDYRDPAATAQQIVEFAGLYRMGFFADLTAMTCGVLEGVIVYTLLRPVGRTLALVVLILDIISNTVSLSASILLYAPLIIVPGTDGMTAFPPAELQALALLSLRMYELAYSVNLALFSGSCLITGYLIFRSTFLPTFLGVLMAIAGVRYLINSVVNFMPSGFGDPLLPWILLPCLLAEGTLALWLTLVGLDGAKWEAMDAAGSRLASRT